MSDFPDISHHNGSPDFAGIRRAGAQLVVLKATEGSGYTDPTFRSNWVHAKTAGLNRTAYHFARPGTDPVLCARGLYTIATDAELPLVLDWEDPAVSVLWAAQFLHETDRLTGRKSIIYMPQSWCSKSGALAEWPLWAARYNWRLGSVKPWSAPTWWQYTDKGQLGPHVGDVSHAYVDLTGPAAPPSSSGEFIVDAEARKYFDSVNLRLDAIGKRLDAMEKDRLLPTTKRVRAILEHDQIPDPA